MNAVGMGVLAALLLLAGHCDVRRRDLYVAGGSLWVLASWFNWYLYVAVRWES